MSAVVDGRPAVYKSTNGGESWRHADRGLGGQAIEQIVIDPLSPRTLYALGGVTGGGALFKSADAAATWRPVVVRAGGVAALAIDPRLPGVLYAVIDKGVVYTSKNGGGTWAAAGSEGFKGFGDALAADPGRSRTLYAVSSVLSPQAPTYVLKTTNGGDSWALAGRKIGQGFRVVAVGAGGGTVYAGTDGDGLYRCTACRALVSPPVPVLHAVGRAGRGLEMHVVTSFALDPTKPRTVYAGTEAGVFVSTDTGRSWRRTGTGPGATDVLGIDPKHPQTLYAFVRGQVFKTLDAGRHWAQLGRGTLSDLHSLAIDPKTPATLYAGSATGQVFKTTDGGKRWRPSGRLGSTNVSEFAIDPHNPRTLYASTQGDGVSKTDDGGAHWHQASDGLTDPSLAVLAIDPAHPQTVYAGTWPSTATEGGALGVFVTHNGGRSWTHPGTGKVQGETVLTLAVDPTPPGAVYAGTDGAGVYRKTARGNRWLSFNTGLQDLTIDGLKFDPRTRTLYVGTMGGAYTITIQTGH